MGKDPTEQEAAEPRLALLEEELKLLRKQQSASNPLSSSTSSSSSSSSSSPTVRSSRRIKKTKIEDEEEDKATVAQPQYTVTIFHRRSKAAQQLKIRQARLKHLHRTGGLNEVLCTDDVEPSTEASE